MKTELFHHLMGIFQALFIFWGAWWSYAYYVGKLKLKAKNEEDRKGKIKKYGWVLIASILVCLLSGLTLMISSLLNIFDIIIT